MTRFSVAAAAGLLVAAAGWVALKAQDPAPEQTDEAFLEAAESGVVDPSCTFFGPERDHFLAALRENHSASHLTEDVVSKLGGGKKVMTPLYATASLPSAPGGSRTDNAQNAAVNLIDVHIFQKMAEQKVAPAPMTNDYEFVRRVTLDLTGRIPTPTEVNTFVSSTDPGKRAKLIDQLLATPQWVDKWTIWLADLYENNSTNNLDANRFIFGVVAFNNFIRSSLQNNKPYDQMVREMIAATGTDSRVQGEMNFLVGGVMGGGPIQDVFDQQAAIISEKFLGLGHVNCLLCHKGAGHLDSLSLWGYYKTRNDAYGMASFLSHTATARIGVDGTAGGNPYYWVLANDIAQNTPLAGSVINRTNYTLDYRLNTKTGNRPERIAPSPQQQSVRPKFILNDASPTGTTNYRQFLAQQLTSDIQFARATVNYVWEYFFGIGLVTPSNQFDPMRLDPDNPPVDCPLEESPCTLQASHPRLLNELAQRFVNSGYSLKALMKDITNSRAYQLSSRYEGTWNPSNERLFARKLVRRLWSEEIHDAITQSSGISATYTNANWNPTSTNWAMQFPEPLNTGPTTFLNAFLRGNRDDEVRSGDPTIAQALSLMNDSFVMGRITNTTPASLVTRGLALSNSDCVQQLYLNVLSRYPTPEELSQAIANIQAAGTAGSARRDEVRALLWSLYNKVDFIYNY